MAAAVVDFILEDLQHILISYGGNSKKNDGMESLYEELQFVRAFLSASEEICNEHDHEELKMLVARIKTVACEALNVFDISVLLALRQNYFTDHSERHKRFIQDIMSVKKKVMDIYRDNLYGIGLPPAEVPSSYDNLSSPSLEEEEIVVGFDDEAVRIMERLVGEKKQLQVVSIVGMAGIGKTTLARKVYNDPCIVHHFYVRAWTYVSQVYRKRDLFIRILSCIVKKEDDICDSSEEKLAEELYRNLKGKRYLILVDDIWNIEVWEDLKRSFPDDNNGSRIMITTRLADVAMRVRKDSPPHVLITLSPVESWDLLQQKAFGGGTCPPELMDIGKEIAAKCGGLPLAIVVVAGILARNEKNHEWWRQFAENLASSKSVVGDATEQFMDILALSYNHLPHHLKSCFLYLGAFPEDYEIPAWRLIWLWIAEGFVKQTRERSLEDVADDYLKDLTNGSLVMVAQRGSSGGIKSCRIHDMLRDLCLTKAKERNVLHQIDWYEQVASPSTPILSTCLCLHSHGFHPLSGNSCEPNVRSVFNYAASEEIPRPKFTYTFIYKLLRVLNLWYIVLTDFPEVVLKLYHLRYLELQVHHLDKLPSKISDLWNLETLCLGKEDWSILIMPPSIWNMVKLRHICISDGIKFEEPCATENGESPVLDSLQSISALPLSQPSNVEDTNFVLARTPKLRKLSLYRGPKDREEICFPDMGNLTHLSKLKFVDNCWEGGHSNLLDPPLMSLDLGNYVFSLRGSNKNCCEGLGQILPPRIPQPSKFPPYLKKLTLAGGRIRWKEISKLGKLPNLEVLKLRRNSFLGPRWETSDGEFPQLKYLKLSWIDLEEWRVTSSSHFPRLERLMLHVCMHLKEVPSCLGDVPTLQMIEISWSSHSASKSVMRIQQEQQTLDNFGLKVCVFPREEDES